MDASRPVINLKRLCVSLIVKRVLQTLDILPMSSLTTFKSSSVAGSPCTTEQTLVSRGYFQDVKFVTARENDWEKDFHTLLSQFYFLLWIFGWLVGWLVGRLVGRSVGWLISWLAGWYVGWSVGWSVGQLVGWLVGWLVACLLASRSMYLLSETVPYVSTINRVGGRGSPRPLLSSGTASFFMQDITDNPNSPR